MTEIEKTYSGKPLRIFIEDGEVLLSVRDLCRLLGDRNSIEAMEFIKDRMERTRDNDELLRTMNE